MLKTITVKGADGNDVQVKMKADASIPRLYRITNSSGIFLRTSALSRSLPTRERGLKFIQLSGQSLNSESLPTRERGLKYFQPVAILYVQRRSLHGSVD